MPELTVDQKIQLMTLASKMSTPLGYVSAEADKTIENYNKLLGAITITPNQTTT